MTQQEMCKKCSHKVVCCEKSYYLNVAHLGEKCGHYTPKTHKATAFEPESERSAETDLLCIIKAIAQKGSNCGRLVVELDDGLQIEVEIAFSPIAAENDDDRG